MKTIFDGFLKIKEFFRESKRYEIMDRGNSVTVLLVKPGLSFEGDQFYIGYQYRAGAGSIQATQVAGMIDKMPDGIGHEPPRQAALREAMEEAGALGRMEYMYSGYTSPGGTTEFTYQFVMMVDTITTPTDPEEGIVWEWMTGADILRNVSMGFASMQLQNAINTYRLNREKFVKGI